MTFKSITVITKKEHWCYSCERKFPKGTKMSYWVGLYEGSFGAEYSCMTCVEFMNMSSETMFPGGYVAEMLYGDDTPETLLERINNPKS